MNYEKFKLVLVKYEDEREKEYADETARRLAEIPAVTAIAVPVSLDYQVIEVEASPTRRIFKIDVGDLPFEEAQRYLEEFKSRVAKRDAQAAIMDDYFFAYNRSQKLSDVEIIK